MLQFEENINITNRKLEGLKESWKDNVQKKFYNDKVDTLNLFFSTTLSRFENIDNQLNSLKQQINNI